MLRRDREIESVIECGDASEARETLEAGKVDIAFLDIEMPEASGLDVASVTGPARPVIVFITAFSQYAPNAFDVDATDYVLKPFGRAPAGGARTDEDAGARASPARPGRTDGNDFGRAAGGSLCAGRVVQASSAAVLQAGRSFHPAERPGHPVDRS